MRWAAPAAAVVLAKVGCPLPRLLKPAAAAATPAAPALGSHGSGGGQALPASDAKDGGSGQRLASCLEAFFSSRPRFLAASDVFGVGTAGTGSAADEEGGGGVSAAAAADVLLAAGGGAPWALHYFRVEAVEAGSSDSARGPVHGCGGGAAGVGACGDYADDDSDGALGRVHWVCPRRTRVVLRGGAACSRLPVGLPGFLAASSAAEPPPHTQRSAARCLPRQRFPAAPSPAIPVPLLGVDACAAWAPAPGLPGVHGPLRDTWRMLARLLSLPLHPRCQGKLAEHTLTGTALFVL